jgi:hypothetical protein
MFKDIFYKIHNSVPLSTAKDNPTYRKFVEKMSKGEDMKEDIQAALFRRICHIEKFDQ